jgi:protein-disulfide isomerase
MAHSDSGEEGKMEEKKYEHKVIKPTIQTNAKPNGWMMKLLVAIVVLQLILVFVVVMQVSKINNNLQDLEMKFEPIQEFFDMLELQLQGQQPPAQPPAQPPTTAVSADDDAVKGDPNAPVTIIEFSDYECPFCAKFYAQTLPELDEKYIKTGKVKLVYRDFPLGNHRYAQKAAEAAECAGEQGKYYEMHDKLFDNGVTGGVDEYKIFAEEIGLDTEEFNECLDNGKMESEVKKDLQDGIAAGVDGTPAFFVNGIRVSGAQPFGVFEQIIEQELAK